MKVWGEKKKRRKRERERERERKHVGTRKRFFKVRKRETPVR
jgi:hypothetical protein